MLNSFKEYFHLQEISDVMFKDTQGISLVPTHDEKGQVNGFYRSFKVKDQDYIVTIKKYQVTGSFVRELYALGASSEKVKEYFKNIYYVEFKGPKGYELHNEFKGPTEVYAQVLLTIKKLTETEPVEGLVFTPYSPEMSLVYNRFVKNFSNLRIVDIGAGLYLSQNLIERIIKDYPEIEKTINYSNQKHSQLLSDIRSSKIEQKKSQRKLSEIYNDMIGKFIGVKSFPNFGLVIGIPRHGLISFYTLEGSNIVTKRAYERDLFRVLGDKAILENIQQFLTILKGKIRQGDPLGQEISRLFVSSKPYDGPLPAEVEKTKDIPGWNYI